MSDFHVPERFRVLAGKLASTAAHGNNGAFWVTLNHKQEVAVIASDGGGWEHVSVLRNDRTPTWDEMCQIKLMFWGMHETVIQYHPAEHDYINCHEFCLHLWRPNLWRPIEHIIPTPPTWMIGPKGH